MATFTHHGFDLAFEERGATGANARPILLLHGLLLPRRHQYALADALAHRGNRVILLDLLGHGESDRSLDPRQYSVELFADQALALLEHLGITQAVVGGTSLGANVALETAIRGGHRVRGLFLEMPVLERATMAAGAIFVPLTLALRRLQRPARSLASLVRHIPRTRRSSGLGLYADVVLDVLGQDPAPSEAIVEGVLSGGIASQPSRREQIQLPTLIVCHEHDPLHPLSDAQELHQELINSKLVRAGSWFELRFPPNRLSDAVADFLDEVWDSSKEQPSLP